MTVKFRMASLADAETKDGRHFPTDAESKVLINHLQIYFSHPQRSIQRAQVVQSVVSILAPNNKHWNHRTVRLWFNNNKKVFYHPKAPVPPEPRKEPLPPPPKAPVTFVPGRSLSVMPFRPVEDNADDAGTAQTTYPVYAHKSGTLALCVGAQYEQLAQNPSPEQKAECEAAITQQIIKIHDDRWQQVIPNRPAKTSIVDPMSINPTIVNPPVELPTVESVAKYDLIHSSTVMPDGDPVVVAFDANEGAQKLFYNGRSANVQLRGPVTAMVYDRENEVIWLHAGDVVRGFDGRTMSAIQSIETGKYCKRSVMALSNDNQHLMVAAGSSIWRWSRKLGEPLMDQNGSEVCLTLSMPSITSLATLGEYVVVASSDYNTAQVYAQNGAIVDRAIGHTSGITALSGFDENCFLSGSADQSVMLWDIRSSIPVVNIMRHRGVVTSIYGDGNSKHHLVLTGGTDGVLRGWDLRAFHHLFTIALGETPPQTLHYSHAGHRITAILSEKTADLYYDTEKYSTETALAVPSHPPNAVVTYNYSI